jgi:hypothetical protein
VSYILANTRWSILEQIPECCITITLAGGFKKNSISMVNEVIGVAEAACKRVKDTDKTETDVMTVSC